MCFYSLYIVCKRQKEQFWLKEDVTYVNYFIFYYIFNYFIAKQGGVKPVESICVANCSLVMAADS